MKNLASALILLLASTVVFSSNLPYQESDVEGAEYKYLNVYFSKNNTPTPKNEFSKDFQQCYEYRRSIAANPSEGYLVMKSLGHSNQQLLIKGIKECLLVKNWALFVLENGQLERLRFNILYSRRESTLTPQQIAQSETDLEKRRAWYKKYASRLVQ